MLVYVLMMLKKHLTKCYCIKFKSILSQLHFVELSEWVRLDYLHIPLEMLNGSTA